MFVRGIIGLRYQDGWRSAGPFVGAALLGARSSKGLRSPHEPDRVLHAKWRHAGLAVPDIAPPKWGAHPGYQPLPYRPWGRPPWPPALSHHARPLLPPSLRAPST